MYSFLNMFLTLNKQTTITLSERRHRLDVGTLGSNAASKFHTLIFLKIINIMY